MINDRVTKVFNEPRHFDKTPCRYQICTIIIVNYNHYNMACRNIFFGEEILYKGRLNTNLKKREVNKLTNFIKMVSETSFCCAVIKRLNCKFNTHPLKYLNHNNQIDKVLESSFYIRIPWELTLFL